MDDITICTVTPKTPWDLDLSEVFDGDEEFILKELPTRPSTYFNEKVWEYLIDNWDIEDILSIMKDYIQFVPNIKGSNIPDMPERFY